MSSPGDPESPPQKQNTTDVDTSPPRTDEDVESDPAGGEWAGEGGATPEGPPTDETAS